MRDMLGCSAMIAAIGFVLGAVGLLFTLGPNLGEVFLGAFFVAAITFVGALFLMVTDRQEHSRHFGLVRTELLKRVEIADGSFTSAFPNLEPSLLLLVRDGIAEFFNVPAGLIHPADKLH